MRVGGKSYEEMWGHRVDAGRVDLKMSEMAREIGRLRDFTVASVVYLALGTSLGGLMAVAPTLIGQITSIHVHLNLLGFVGMMIYGVSYHVVPRFTGRKLYSEGLPRIQFWLANVGLVGMALGFFMRDILLLAQPLYLPFLGVFAGVELISVYLYVYNVLRTLASKPVMVL